MKSWTYWNQCEFYHWLQCGQDFTLFYFSEFHPLILKRVQVMPKLLPWPAIHPSMACDSHHFWNSYHNQIIFSLTRWCKPRVTPQKSIELHQYKTSVSDNRMKPFDTWYKVKCKEISLYCTETLIWSYFEARFKF